MTRTTRRLLVGVVAAVLIVPVAALASHRFTDVPDSNVFHDDITWLADTGVTIGCNPPDNTEFCPDDFVTREQMAAFMKRLGINQVVDAGLLEGNTAADLQTTVHGLNSDNTAVDLADGVDTMVLQKTVNEAAGANAMVTYSLFASSNGGGPDPDDGDLRIWVQVDNETCLLADAQPGSLTGASADDDRLANPSASIVLPISGETTLTLCAQASNAAFVGHGAALNSVHTNQGQATVESP